MTETKPTNGLLTDRLNNTRTKNRPIWRQSPTTVLFRTTLKAGFHMIADDRGSRIADRKKFCDCQRSYGNTLLRSSAILRSWSQTIAEDRTMFYLLRSSAIVCDQLRSCDHMETTVLRSAIETYPIIFWIPTHDSTLLCNKATAYLL